MERIEIIDSGLLERVNRIVKDLHEYYPDGSVYSVGKLHKSLSNRITKAYKEIGYESPKDFYAAYGFSVSSNRGGRPTVATKEAAEDLFKELLSRYEGQEKPKHEKTLREENPDLSGLMHTYSSKSQELFGMSWSRVLQERGVLEGKKTISVSEIFEDPDKIYAMIDDLKECYKNASIKPSTVKDLITEHPEYVEELTVLKRASPQIYGMTMAKYLQNVGVIQASASKIISADDVEKIIEDLVSRFGSYDNDDKPSSFDALLKSASDIGNEIKSASKSWEKINDGNFILELKHRGVMRMNFTDQRRSLVRNASLSNLIKIWRAASGPSEIDSLDKIGCLLPDGVVAIDLDENLQLEEFITCFSTNDCPQELLDENLLDDLLYRIENEDIYIMNASGSILLKKAKSLFKDFKFFDNPADDWCTLKAREHAELVSVTPLSADLLAGKNPALVQVRLFSAMPLKSQTLLHLLYETGLITANDLKAGYNWQHRDYSAISIAQ